MNTQGSSFQDEELIAPGTIRERRQFIHPVNSGGVELEEPKVPDLKTFIPVNSGGETLSNTIEQKRLMDNSIRAFVATGNNPSEEQAKIDISRFLSSKSGVSFEAIYNNYDENIEQMLGYTLKPTAGLKFITDQYTANDIDVKISELQMQKLRTPGANYKSIDAEIQRLEESKPPVDPFKHSVMLDAVGTAASMIPYIKEVGQYAIPGAVISLAAGTMSGGTGTMASAASVLKTVGTLVSIWGRAKSFDVGYTQSAGSLYGTLTEMKDENGDPIDDGIARKVSMIAGLPIAGLEAIGGEYFFTGNSVFKNIAKKIGGEALKKRVEMAAAKTLTGLTISGFFQETAKKMAKRTGEMLIHEILLEEVPQDLMEVQAIEMAKHFTNDLKGTEFSDITSAEQLERTKNVIIESFKGMLVLGLGRSSVGSAVDFAKYTQDRIATDKNKSDAEAIKAEDVQMDFAAKATDEDYSILEADDLTASEIETYNRVDITSDNSTVTAKTTTGKQAGNITYTVNENEVLIDSMDVANTNSIKIGSDMMAELQAKFPGKKIILSETASAKDTIGRAIEDLDPELQIQNLAIDEAKNSIAIVEQDIVKLQEEIKDIQAQEEDEGGIKLAQLAERQQALAEAEDNLSTSQESLKLATKAKKASVKATPKPVRTMTAKEYETEVVQPAKEAKKFRNTPEGQKLSEELKANIDMSAEEYDVSVDLIEAIANAKDMTPQQYLKENFPDGKVFGKQFKTKNKGGRVTYLEDGKNIIETTKNANFSTWIHELGHILMRNLNEKDRIIAFDWAKAEAIKRLQKEYATNMSNTNDLFTLTTKFESEIKALKETEEFTPSMMEVFAEGFERYIQEGKTQSKGLKKIFDKMAKFMKAIYESVVGKPWLSDEIKQVFANQLSDTRISELEKGKAEPMVSQTLYQTIKKRTEAFKNWFKNSKVVDENGDPLVVYRSDKTQIESYDITKTGSGGQQFGKGFYFTDIKEYAELYNGQTQNYYLSIQNPITWDRRNKKTQSIANKIAKKYGSTIGYVVTNPEVFTEGLIKEGYDGIIVTLNDKIGTKEIITFEPTQIKSVENKGTYGIDDPRILYQTINPEYTKSIKDAVAKGYNVSEEILQQFPEEQWAKDVLAKREAESQMLSDFSFFTPIARDAKDMADFVDKANMYMGPEIDKLDGKSRKWYEDFYTLATKEQGVTDINEGNKQWRAGLTDEYIKAVIEAVGKNLKQAKSNGINRRIIQAGTRYEAKQTIGADTVKIVRNTLANNPTFYRTVVSEMLGDIDEVSKVEQERAFTEELGLTEEVKEDKIIETRLSLADKLKSIATKKGQKITDADISKVIKDSSKMLVKSDEAIKGLEKDLQQHKREWNERLDKIVDIRKREALAAKDDKKLAIQEAIKKEKARKKALEKKQKDAKVIKAHMRKLGEQITKKPPSTVDITYQLLMEELQNSIDPKFRSKAKLSEKIELRKFYEANPEIADIMPKSFIDNLQKLSLNEMDLGQLEYVKAKMDMLKAAGKAKFAYRENIRKEANKVIKGDIIQALLKGEEVDLPEFTLGEGLTGKEKAYAAILQTYRPSRVADMMDGGKEHTGGDYKGPMFNLMFNEVNKAYDNELRQKHRREQAMTSKMKELGLKNKDFERVVEIRGIKTSIDEIADIYAGWKNEKKKNALEHGNGITQELHDEMISHLTKEEMAMADYIIKDYTDNFIRLRDAFRRDKNLELPQEEFYTPIRRVLGGMTSEDMTTSEELINRQQYGRASIMKKFTITRKELGDKQSQLSLGIVSQWKGEVAKQEHYINNMDIIKQMNSILNDKEINGTAKYVGKMAHLNYLKEYSRVYANPTVDKSNKGLDSIVRGLKNGSAIAYLGGNMLTMFKQIPSMVYYSAYSSPADILASIYEVTTNWDAKRAIMEQYSPQSTYGRSFEAYVDRINQKGKSKVYNKIKALGSYSLKGLELFDRIAVTIGWTAVYNKNLRNGTGEVEAARRATQATLFTQPASAAKDTAPLYRDDNFLSVFLQFSNQLNQIWNQISYDAPAAIKHKHYMQATAMYMGVALGATFLWSLSNRRLPEDKEDLVDVFTDTAFSIFPAVGRTMGNMVDGYDLSIPVLAPIQGAATGIQLAKKMVQGDDITGVQVERLLKDMAQGMAVGAGLPYTETYRIYKGFKEQKYWQYIIFGGEFNDK